MERINTGMTVSNIIENSQVTTCSIGEYLPRRLIPLPMARDKCRFLRHRALNGRTNSSDNDRYCPELDLSKEKYMTPQHTLRNYGYLCEKVFLDDSNYLKSQMLGNRNTLDWNLKLPSLKNGAHLLLKKRAFDYAFQDKKGGIDALKETMNSNKFECDIKKLQRSKYDEILRENYFSITKVPSRLLCFKFDLHKTKKKKDSFSPHKQKIKNDFLYTLVNNRAKKKAALDDGNATQDGNFFASKKRNRNSEMSALEKNDQKEPSVRNSDLDQ